MSNITELAAEIISAHASSSPMTTEELLNELQQVHAALKALESGEAVPAAEEAKPAISAKASIKTNEIICLICGRGKMKTLTRHLSSAHGITAKEYKKQFGIKGTQSLSAKSLTESRKAGALARGLGDNLVKARAVRMANITEAKKTTKLKTKAAPKKK
jgi:predicted transcriptional regulator